MDNVYLILATTILIILIITLIFRRNKERFTNYLDVRTKTLNWCNKLKESGVMNQQQYEECLNRFKENTAGIVPEEMITPEIGMERDYSLYKSKEKGLTSNITGGDTNNVILASYSGLFMVCSPDNKISFVRNIDDPTINQDGLKFTLSPQSGDVYAIVSPYGKYLTATDALTAEFIGTSVGNSSSWIITRIDNKILFESVFYKGFYLSFKDEDNSLAVVYGQNDNMNWTIISQSSGEEGGNVATVYKGEEYIVRKENVIDAYENAVRNKKILETLVQGLRDLKNTITSNLEIARGNFNDMINAKIAASTETIEETNRETFNETFISQALDSITNLEVAYSQQLDKEISALNMKLIGINIAKQISDIDALANEMKQDTTDTDSRINQNNLIMNRQQQNYEKINDQLDKINVKMDNFKTGFTTSGLNMEIVKQNNAANNYKITIYKVAIFVLGLVVIYMAYSTAGKFKTNIYDKYM